MKFSLIMALLLCAGLPAKAADDKADDQVVMVDPQDKDMNEAIKKAQASLDQFLAVVDKKPAGVSGFKLKVRFEDANGVEHFWMTPFKRDGKGFVGVLANEPEIVTSLEAGKTYKFSRAQISDWGYVRDGKQVGSFTVCVLFKTMSKEEVEQYKNDYGFECKS